MKKFIIAFTSILLFVASFNPIQAQIVNGAYKRTTVASKKPMPLPTIQESDVFWSKKIWRVIDLREKMNLPLYFPTTPMDEHKSLISLLMEGIENAEITAYDARLDDDFQVPMTYDQVKESFGAETRMEEKVDFDTGETTQVEIAGEARLGEVKQYLIKEEWFFDKKASSLDVRVIGICPIREFVRMDDPSGEVQRQKLFWIYYPHARPLLANNVALNPYNNAQSLSFDDIFIKRFFNSYIIRESNIYNNRDISAYLTGKDVMLESKKIENEIFDFEQDLWEY